VETPFFDPNPSENGSEYNDDPVYKKLIAFLNTFGLQDIDKKNAKNIFRSKTAELEKIISEISPFKISEDGPIEFSNEEYNNDRGLLVDKFLGTMMNLPILLEKIVTSLHLISAVTGTPIQKEIRYSYLDEKFDPRTRDFIISLKCVAFYKKIRNIDYVEYTNYIENEEYKEKYSTYIDDELRSSFSESEKGQESETVRPAKRTADEISVGVSDVMKKFEASGVKVGERREDKIERKQPIENLTKEQLLRVYILNEINYNANIRWLMSHPGLGIEVPEESNFEHTPSAQISTVKRNIQSIRKDIKDLKRSIKNAQKQIDDNIKRNLPVTNAMQIDEQVQPGSSFGGDSNVEEMKKILENFQANPTIKGMVRNNAQLEDAFYAFASAYIKKTTSSTLISKVSNWIYEKSSVLFAKMPRPVQVILEVICLVLSELFDVFRVLINPLNFLKTVPGVLLFIIQAYAKTFVSNVWIFSLTRDAYTTTIAGSELLFRLLNATILPFCSFSTFDIVSFVREFLLRLPNYLVYFVWGAGYVIHYTGAILTWIISFLPAIPVPMDTSIWPVFSEILSSSSYLAKIMTDLTAKLAMDTWKAIVYSEYGQYFIVFVSIYLAYKIYVNRIVGKLLSLAGKSILFSGKWVANFVYRILKKLVKFKKEKNVQLTDFENNILHSKLKIVGKHKDESDNVSGNGTEYNYELTFNEAEIDTNQGMKSGSKRIKTKLQPE
jgi:hypothetical protein